MQNLIEKYERSKLNQWLQSILNMDVKIGRINIPVLLLAAFSLAVLLRFLLLMDRYPDVPTAMGDYWSVIAKSLYEGKGYTGNGEFIFFRPPAYPLFLFTLYKLFDFSLLVGLLFQCIFEGLSTLLIYFLLIKITNSRISSTLGAILYAFWIPQYPRIVNLLPEYLYALLIILSYYLLWYIYKHNKSSSWYFLYGFLMGVIALTRPQGTFLFIAILLGLLFYKNYKIIIYSFIAFLITVSPWIIYSSVHSSRINFLSKEAGHALWARNSVLDNDNFFDFTFSKKVLHERRKKAFKERGLDIADYEGLKSNNIEIYDKIGNKEFFRLIKERPVKFMALIIVKWLEYSFGINFTRDPPRLDPDQFLFNGTLMILFIFGVFLNIKKMLCRKNPLLITMIIFVLFQVGLHSLTVSSAKNNISTIPVMLVITIILWHMNFMSYYKKDINTNYKNYIREIN